jgi:hypothetical protein
MPIGAQDDCVSGLNVAEGIFAALRIERLRFNGSGEQKAGQ